MRQERRIACRLGNYDFLVKDTTEINVAEFKDIIV